MYLVFNSNVLILIDGGDDLTSSFFYAASTYILIYEDGKYSQPGFFE